MKENNKRIAKNTLFLYFRMLLILAVSLYTSRMILLVLGIEDYGIFNIVGCVVIFFYFLQSALTQATQRFLTIELGKSDIKQFKKIFSLNLLIYIALSLCIVIFAETIGLWFLNTQLNIPLERMYAANWVYQFTIIVFILNLVRTPYNSAIIAHERMSFYAYVSIMEIILKLSVVYLLFVGDFDRLILYSILTALVALVTLLIYIYYCTKKYQECQYQYYWNKELFKQLLTFSGWSTLGSVLDIATRQGINILLNIFYGVVANTAMGITNQVSGAINQFVNNFQIAFQPQIMKTYAEENKVYLDLLVFRSAKISYYLFFILSLPILINTETILSLWLGKTPEYTVSFIKFSLLALLIDTLSGPLWMLLLATGKIQKYQIITSFILVLYCIISFIFFKLGFNPVVVFIVRCGISILFLFIRIELLSRILKFKSQKYITDVFMRCVAVGCIACVLPWLSRVYFEDFIGLFWICLVSILSTLLTIYIIGLSRDERRVVHTMICKKLNNFITK